MVRTNYETLSFNNARGGKGPWHMQQLLLPQEFLGHGRLFSRATLPAGSSIGWHRHVDEFEVYYALSGEALYTDEDGTKTLIGAGDLAAIQPGKCHMIENVSDADFEAIFLIINAEGKTEGSVKEETPGNL